MDVSTSLWKELIKETLFGGLRRLPLSGAGMSPRDLADFRSLFSFASTSGEYQICQLTFPTLVALENHSKTHNIQAEFASSLQKQGTRFICPCCGNG
jgi:hypothetical protein